MHALWPFPWKQSLWQDTDQVSTNHNVWIYLMQDSLAKQQFDTQSDNAEAIIMT